LGHLSDTRGGVEARRKPSVRAEHVLSQQRKKCFSTVPSLAQLCS
jgi:hypothetical protein